MAGNEMGDTQRLEREIARRDETIQELRTTIISNEERIKKLEDGEEANKKKIKALEDENKALKKEIDELKNEKKSLVKQLQKINEVIEEIVQDKKDNKEREDKEKSVLIIIQIGTAIQRNICKYVLGKHFKESNFYKVKYMEKYIAKLTEPAEKKSAEERWSELKAKNIWDESLIESLKNLNQTRIGIAHPELTSEKIQQAMDCLKEDPEFMNQDMLDNIRKLKKYWETSESLLRESANEKQVRGKRRSGKRKPQTAYPSTKRQRLQGSQVNQYNEIR